MQIAIFWGIMQFGQLQPTFFFAAYLQAQLVSNGPHFTHGTFSREFFGRQWREYGRNRGKYAKYLGKGARLSAIAWAFPRGEIILGILEVPGAVQNTKWAVATITNYPRNWQELSKTNENQTGLCYLLSAVQDFTVLLMSWLKFRSCLYPFKGIRQRGWEQLFRGLFDSVTMGKTYGFW